MAAMSAGAATWASPMRSRFTRFAAGVVFAVVAAFAVLALSQVLNPNWWSQDTDAYWNAALRLRHGQPLYPPLANPDASDTYRYAPWFSLLWVPLTYLPQVAVYAAWTAVLLASAVACVWVVVRRISAAGVLLGMVVGSLLIPAAASGNVQPLLLATLALGVERRSGPAWIALAASLKAAPLLLVAVYLGRREWGRAAAALALALVLVAPMLAFDLTHYPTQTAAAAGPLPEWLALALAVVATAFAVPLARTRYGWLSAAVAVMLAIPRWSYYQPSFLLLGLPADEPAAKAR